MAAPATQGGSCAWEWGRQEGKGVTSQADTVSGVPGGYRQRPPCLTWKCRGGYRAPAAMGSAIRL